MAGLRRRVSNTARFLIQAFLSRSHICFPHQRNPSSACRPGVESALSFATVSFPMLSPRLNQRYVGDTTAPRGTGQSHRASETPVFVGFAGHYGTAGRREVVPEVGTCSRSVWRQVPVSPPPQDHDAQSSRLNTALRLQPGFRPGISRLVGGFAHGSFWPCEYPRGYPSGTKRASAHDAEGILADYCCCTLPESTRRDDKRGPGLMPCSTSGGADCGTAARSDLWGRKPNG